MFILPSIQLSFYLIDVVRVCIHITHYPHLAYRVFSPVLLQITQMPIAHHLPAALHTDESARLPNSIHSSILIDNLCLMLLLLFFSLSLCFTLFFLHFRLPSYNFILLLIYLFTYQIKKKKWFWYSWQKNEWRKRIFPIPYFKADFLLQPNMERDNNKLFYDSRIWCIFNILNVRQVEKFSRIEEILRSERDGESTSTASSKWIYHFT